jgi:hypothetical protein
VGGTVAIVGGNVVFTPTASNGQPASLTVIDGNGSSTLQSMWQSPGERRTGESQHGHGLDPDQHPTGWHCGAGQQTWTATPERDGATVNPQRHGQVNANGTWNFTRPTTSLASLISYSIKRWCKAAHCQQQLTVNVGNNTAPTMRDAGEPCSR